MADFNSAAAGDFCDPTTWNTNVGPSSWLSVDNAGTFTMSGDQTPIISAGMWVYITGSTNNNGIWHIATVTVDGNGDTGLTFVESLPSLSDASGTLISGTLPGNANTVLINHTVTLSRTWNYASGATMEVGTSGIFSLNSGVWDGNITTTGDGQVLSSGNSQIGNITQTRLSDVGSSAALQITAGTCTCANVTAATGLNGYAGAPCVQVDNGAVLTCAIATAGGGENANGTANDGGAGGDAIIAYGGEVHVTTLHAGSGGDGSTGETSAYTAGKTGGAGGRGIVTYGGVAITIGAYLLAGSGGAGGPGTAFDNSYSNAQNGGPGGMGGNAIEGTSGSSTITASSASFTGGYGGHGGDAGQGGDASGAGGNGGYGGSAGWCVNASTYFTSISVDTVIAGWAGAGGTGGTGADDKGSPGIGGTGGVGGYSGCGISITSGIVTIVTLVIGGSGQSSPGGNGGNGGYGNGTGTGGSGGAGGAGGACLHGLTMVGVVTASVGTALGGTSSYDGSDGAQGADSGNPGGYGGGRGGGVSGGNGVYVNNSNASLHVVNETSGGSSNYGQYSGGTGVYVASGTALLSTWTHGDSGAGVGGWNGGGTINFDGSVYGNNAGTFSLASDVTIGVGNFARVEGGGSISFQLSGYKFLNSGKFFFDAKSRPVYTDATTAAVNVTSNAQTMIWSDNFPVTGADPNYPTEGQVLNGVVFGSASEYEGKRVDCQIASALTTETYGDPASPLTGQVDLSTYNPKATSVLLIAIDVAKVKLGYQIDSTDASNHITGEMPAGSGGGQFNPYLLIP